MKIVHLSDTHCGVRANLERLDSIVSMIVRTYDPRNTIVVHTGDLIDSYNELNCRLASASLKPLRNCGFRILLCPGNHDYGNRAYTDNVFAQAYRDYFAKDIFGDNSHVFPVVNYVGDCAFIGIDTMQDELGFFSRIWAEGNIGPSQREKLTRRIKEAKDEGKKVVVYMHHHPFINGYSIRPDIGDPNMALRMLQWLTKPFRRLKDAYSFIMLVRDRVDVLLFGHQHTGLNHAFEAERYGLKIALDGSSSTVHDMPMDDMHIRVIDTDTMTSETVLIPI